MPFWVYILLCNDGSYYTGHTDDLAMRLAQHDLGSFDGYTSTRKPLRMVFSSEFPTREAALSCEMQIKRWSRRKKEALIRGDWEALRRAARKNFGKAHAG